MTTKVDTDKLAALREIASDKYANVEIDYRGNTYIRDVKAIDNIDLLVSLYPELPAGRLRAIERLKSVPYRQSAGYKHKISKSGLKSLITILGAFPSEEELTPDQRVTYEHNHQLIQLIINDAVASLAAAEAKHEEWCEDEGKGNVQIVDKL